MYETKQYLPISLLQFQQSNLENSEIEPNRVNLYQIRGNGKYLPTHYVQQGLTCSFRFSKTCKKDLQSRDLQSALRSFIRHKF